MAINDRVVIDPKLNPGVVTGQRLHRTYVWCGDGELKWKVHSTFENEDVLFPLDETGYQALCDVFRLTDRDKDLFPADILKITSPDALRAIHHRPFLKRLFDFFHGDSEMVGET